MQYIIVNKYADNGEFSHEEIIHKETGESIDLKKYHESLTQELSEAKAIEIASISAGAEIAKELAEAKKNSIDWKNNCDDSDEIIHAIKLELAEAKAWIEKELQVKYKFFKEYMAEPDEKDIIFDDWLRIEYKSEMPPTTETKE